jgi:hypothetical protein
MKEGAKLYARQINDGTFHFFACACLMLATLFNMLASG